MSYSEELGSDACRDSSHSYAPTVREENSDSDSDTTHTQNDMHDSGCHIDEATMKSFERR